MKINIQSLLLVIVLTLLIFSCKKDKEETPIQETGTVTDVEGNVYKTIKIGDQWWMAENLKCTKYSNGSFIQIVSDNSEWTTTAKGAYCNYDNKTDYISTYGRLYNWFAINDSNQLAPQGWHIATDADWKTLERELGMSEAEANTLGWRGTKEAEKLKIESPLGWTEVSPVWSNNSSGFTALAGGCRLFNGIWSDPGLFATGFWWTASVHDSNEAWYRYLDKKNSDIFRSHTYKNYGLSVRCVKD